MADIDRALEQVRDALDVLSATAEQVKATWAQPTAPGKWSPSQVTEHVARALEESAHTAAGEPSKFPTFPAFIHPIARNLFFKRVLRQTSFPKARTTKPMNPDRGPATPAEARIRLEDALVEFDRACRGCQAGEGLVRSTIFGSVPVLDFVRFQEIHVRHHTGQMAPKS